MSSTAEARRVLPVPVGTMQWPRRSAPLRSAVFHVLMSDELDGILCSFQRLIAPLNAICEGGGSDECAVIDHHLILDCFRSRGGERHYIHSYQDLKILLYEGGESEHYLLGRVGMRQGKSNKIYEFARFTLPEGEEPLFLGHEVLPGPASHEEMQSHPLDQSDVVRRIVDAIPRQVKENLDAFLKEERLEQQRRAATDGKKKKAERAKNSKRSKIRSQPHPENLAQTTTATAPAIPEPSPAGTRRKQRPGKEKLDPEETPANETDNGDRTGEGSVKTAGERLKREIANAINANSNQLEELVAELRRKLSKSEKESEARKRSAAFHQTKCQALQKDKQEINAAAAEREGKLRATVTELQKRCQHLTDDFGRKLHDAEAESKAREASVMSYKTDNMLLRIKLRELQEVLDEERNLRTQREEELLGPLRQSKLELAEELEKATADVRDKDAEIQKLTASLKRIEMLRPSQKPAEVSNKKISKLQRELQETQKKLILEKKKNASSAPAAKTKMDPRGKPELKDWIGPCSGGVTGIEVLKPGDTLDGVTAKGPGSNANGTTLSEMAEAIKRESAPIAFSGLEEDETSADKTNGRLGDELVFLASAYSSDEIKVEDGKITRALKLNAGDSNGHLTVNLTVGIPDEYPESGILKVSACLAVENRNCSKDVWKCAEDSLPGLVDVCKWEAEGCAGSEALLSVLNIADDWVENQWNAVHARRFFPSSKKSDAKAGGDCKICHTLVYTHHIVDLEKIHFVKHTASKHDLGGFIKVGRPGLIVVEGLEENCDSFLSTIMLQRKKMRESNKGKTDSSTFSEAGKAFLCASDLDSGRRLPEKFAQLESCSKGMDEFKAACEGVGLKSYLEEACKR